MLRRAIETRILRSLVRQGLLKGEGKRNERKVESERERVTAGNRICNVARRKRRL